MALRSPTRRPLAVKPRAHSIAFCLVLTLVSAGPAMAQLDQLYAGIGRSTEGWTLAAAAGYETGAGLLYGRALASRRGLFSHDGAADLGLLYGFPFRIRDVAMVSVSAGVARTVISRRGAFIDYGGVFGAPRYEQDKTAVVGLPFQLGLTDPRGATVFLFGNLNHEQSYFGFLLGLTFQ